MKYIVGNWKSQKTIADGLVWLEKFSSLYRPADGVKVVLAPTFLSITKLTGSVEEKKLKNFFFAVQDLSPFPRGNYTGAVAADLVKEVAQYAIVGHTERRRYFHETIQDTLNKATEAEAAGVIPLVCVEEAAQLLQLSSLADLDGDVLLAYTPRDPAVSGIAEPIAKVKEMVTRMRRSLPRAAILYGGAVTKDNCGEYLAIEGVAGLFVGRASLDATTFAAICNNI